MLSRAVSTFIGGKSLRSLWMGAAALGLCGCASEGPLHPPSLHVPTAVQNLSAERFGDAVELRWNTPARSTDGVSLSSIHHSHGPFVAEICRSAAVLPAGPCSTLTTLPVEPGKSAYFRDVLMPPWSEGAVRAVYYRVRVLNGKLRGGDGTEIVVAGGAGIPPLARLQAAPAAGGGVTLRWMPLQSSSGSKVILRVVRGDAARPETLAVEPTPTDPGGATDAAARAGVQQSYTGFRTRVVTFGTERLTLNSATATATVARDALPAPPSAPIGLDAVINTLQSPEIDLVWQTADQNGVVGYVVFRAEGDAPPVAITPEPIPASSYSDTAVRLGIRYRYSVASVDRNGARGSLSAEIERTIAAP